MQTYSQLLPHKLSCTMSSVCGTDLAPLWLGRFDGVRLHGGDWLLSTTNQTAREYEVNIVISVAMAIEQCQATPGRENTILFHKARERGGVIHRY